MQSEVRMEYGSGPRVHSFHAEYAHFLIFRNVLVRNGFKSENVVHVIFYNTDLVQHTFRQKVGVLNLSKCHLRSNSAVPSKLLAKISLLREKQMLQLKFSLHAFYWKSPLKVRRMQDVNRT